MNAYERPLGDNNLHRLRIEDLFEVWVSEKNLQIIFLSAKLCRIVRVPSGSEELAELWPEGHCPLHGFRCTVTKRSEGFLRRPSLLLPILFLAIRHRLVGQNRLSPTACKYSRQALIARSKPSGGSR